jgi:hypothetical protein
MNTKIISKDVSVTDTAKLIRQILKEKFSKCKFSVKSHKYAGGASINIYYTDFIPSSEIEQVVKRFQRAKSIVEDYKEYQSSLEVSPTGELIKTSYGSDFVFVHRDYSEKYNWLLCNELDLRTAPNVKDQFHNFIKEYSGHIENSSVKVTDKKIIFDLGASYDPYQLPNSLECLTKQDYITELIKEENNYKVIIHLS